MITAAEVSTAVPVEVLPTVSPSIAVSDYSMSSSSAMPTLFSVKAVSSVVSPWAAQLNQNAGVIELTHKYLAGQGIVTGFSLSTAPTGLLGTISSGAAFAGNLVSAKNSQTFTLIPNATNYVWVKNDAGIFSNSTGTPPTASAVYIGWYKTNGSAVTATDQSGSPFLKCGIPYKHTGDIYTPLDTPSTAWFGFVQTVNGMYLWNGSEYRDIGKNLFKLSTYTDTKLEVPADRFTVVTNEGASSKVTATLETAQVGITREFYIQNTQGMKIYANGGDTIRLGTAVSSTAGYVDSTVVGSALVLKAINSNEWVAFSLVGTWTIV